MHRIIPILIMLATYLALTPRIDLSQVALGLVIGSGILWLLRPKRRSVQWSRLPSSFGAMMVYLWVLIRNVIISGIQVVKIVMHPKLPINPGIIAFAPECHSEIGRALAAHAISLAPGELLIEMARDGTMYIHSLDVEASKRLVKASQNVRRDLLKKIFD